MNLAGRRGRLGLVIMLAGFFGVTYMKLWDLQEWPGFAFFVAFIAVGCWLFVDGDGQG